MTTNAERQRAWRLSKIAEGGKVVNLVLDPQAAKDLLKARRVIALAGLKPTDASAIAAALRFYAVQTGTRK